MKKETLLYCLTDYIILSYYLVKAAGAGQRARPPALASGRKNNCSQLAPGTGTKLSQQPKTKAPLSIVAESRAIISEPWAWVELNYRPHAYQALSRHLARDWWERTEKAAVIARVPGRGWHSLRRKFATELKGASLKDLCALGGWKDHNTILKRYQQADPEAMRIALEQRGVLRKGPVW